MNQTTVTMPMREYKENEAVIEQLHKVRIENFLKKEFNSLKENDYTVSVDMDKVNEYLDKHYPDRQKAVFKTVGPSEYIITKQQPTIRMTCMSCGYKERSKFARIKNCPECDGLLVDPYDSDMMDRVLEKAGYVNVRNIKGTIFV